MSGGQVIELQTWIEKEIWRVMKMISSPSDGYCHNSRTREESISIVHDGVSRGSADSLVQ